MNLHETAAQHSDGRGTGSPGRQALFPMTVRAVRREAAFARPAGGPFTDGDIAHPRALVRSGAR
ncbi:hypothetical protein [Streptomyces sp. NPDC058861]|uniref:hypothetical protein n=1 Tax=Streptomyces sp. NPDC058861 TaxID=3346653 RepID=UPI00369F787C